MARVETASVILLNGHAVKLPYKYLWLTIGCPAALNLGQKNLFAVNSSQWRGPRSVKVLSIETGPQA